MFIKEIIRLRKDKIKFVTQLTAILSHNYTSRGHGCGFYSELIFVDSKALKWAHSRLRNYFSNAAIGQKQPIENRIRVYIDHTS
jgi:hypothetical protein